MNKGTETIDQQQTDTYWVCVDCYYAHHGLSDDEHGRAGYEPLSLIPARAHVTSGLVAAEHDDGCPNFDADGSWSGEHDEPCEERDFSWNRCEGCFSHLGGSRHALTVWFDADGGAA